MYNQNILIYFKKKIYSNNINQNISFWDEKKSFLWYGDKCYHMIDHAYNHITDNWKLTNNLLPILISNCLLSISDEDLYCFCMAMWLHDIGHKGNHKYGESYSIRDVHGIISGELILNDPELFNVIEYDDKRDIEFYDKYFENLQVTNEFNVCEMIKNRAMAGLTNLEKTALFSIFHKSNAPLSEEDINTLLKKGKLIPEDYYQYELGERTNQIISLEKILQSRGLSEDCTKNFLTLAALFRFIDGLDLHKTRVGIEQEHVLKTLVINNDLRFNKTKLYDMVIRLCYEFVSKNEITDADLEGLFISSLYNFPIKIIDCGDFYFNSDWEEHIKDMYNPPDSYFMLLFYIYFISLQSGHFNLHKCVDEIDIVHSAVDKNIEIIYTLNQGMGWLEANYVQETRTSQLSIFSKLFGKYSENENILPYPLQELSTGLVYLKNILNISSGIKLTLEFPTDTGRSRMTRKFVLVDDEVQMQA